MTATQHRFQPIKSVTLPVIKLTPNKDWVYVAFLGPMHTGKKIDDQKEAATVARVVVLDTGEEGQIICSTVLKKELLEQYSNDAYVGRGFGIKMTRDPEKKYNVPSIVEVSIPDELQPAVERLMGKSGSLAAIPAGKQRRA